MEVIRIQDLTKAFGINEIFHNVSFTIAHGDKIGLIGPNGTGKSTLLRCILGEEEATAGEVIIPQGVRISYVEQQTEMTDRTLWDELHSAYHEILSWRAELADLETIISEEQDEEKLATAMRRYERITLLYEQAGGYQYEALVRRVAHGLGFGEADMERTVSEFSGGQITRILLAKALIRQPDFLFLDEPTNHLDIKMVEWLEKFLAEYSGGVLLISHDRYFLDHVVTGIVSLEHHTADVYRGNYTRYLEQKTLNDRALKSAYDKQQAQIAKTEEYIRKYKAGIKSKQARGREKQLKRLERIVLPPEASTFQYFAFHPPAECAQRVAELENVSAHYDGRTVFAGLDLVVKNGDGIALIGPNGAGKTTLLKLLTGELTSPTGRVKLGNRVKVGYFSQHHEGLNHANTLLDEIVGEFGVTLEQARGYLGAFLFRGEDVYKIIGDLSGGEQARVAFLKLMMSGANFLVLDEPTNHLDIPAKEAVESALMSFPGTFLAVSHDRYFLDKVANWIVELDDGKLTSYNGTYSYYQEMKERERAEEEALRLAQQASVPPKEKTQRPAPQAEKTEDKPKPTAKPKRTMSAEEREKRVHDIEGEIVMLEMELKGLEYQLSLPESHADAQTAADLTAEYEATAKKLEAKYSAWEELQEE